MKKKHKKTIIITALLAVVLLFVWKNEIFEDNFSGTQDSRPVSTVKVITQPVVINNNDRLFEAVGTGRARLSVRLFPSVSEEVKEILFEAEQKVKKGDLLVRLDDREEKLALELARIKLKDAESLLNRYRKAVKEGGVPESEVDSARADFESAQIALDQASLALEERYMIAPFDGVVGIPDVDPGDRVTPSTYITSLDNREILYVDFEIPEALASALQNKDKGAHAVTATTPAYPSRVFSGHISTQESQVNPERRTLLVRANIENTEDLLRPGMSFTTHWKIKGRDYPTVSEISLQWSRDGAYIWVINEDNIAKNVPVRVIARKAGNILVEGDVKEGDRVVLEGLQRLRPDIRVDVLGEEIL